VSEDQKPPPPPPKRDHDGLPSWLTASIVAVFAVALLIHIAADMANQSYDGQSTSLMLGGIVGSALAADRIVRKGGGDK
jgi:hypothetical protein